METGMLFPFYIFTDIHQSLTKISQTPDDQPVVSFVIPVHLCCCHGVTILADSSQLHSVPKNQWYRRKSCFLSF